MILLHVYTFQWMYPLKVASKCKQTIFADHFQPSSLNPTKVRNRQVQGESPMPAYTAQINQISLQPRSLVGREMQGWQDEIKTHRNSLE